MLYIDGDPTIGRSLELYGEYCHAEVEVIKSFVTKDSWFIDVGANIGTHTVGVSPYVDRVIAFEPDLDNFDVLVKNCSGCACSNVTPTRLALSDMMSKPAHSLIMEKLHFQQAQISRLRPLTCWVYPKRIL